MSYGHAFNRIVVRLSFVLVFLVNVPHAEASPPGSPFRVVVLGSSTAEGANASPLSSSWVNLYAAHLATVIPGSQVVNLAIGGYLTFNIMPTGSIPPSPWNSPGFQPVSGNNITAALAQNPDLIIINLPTNDCDLHVPIDLQLENYAAIVGAAAAQGVPVWISTPQPRNNDPLGLQLLRGMFSSTYEVFPERTIDFWTGLADADGRILPAYNSDGTHLNNAGHAILYDRARATIVTSPPALPSIAMHPRGRSVMENDSTSFFILALGTEGTTYQWQRNGIDIPGATSSRYEIPHAAVADSGAAYRCIVTGNGMSVTSNTAQLIVARLPQPPSATVVSDDFSAPTLNTSRWTFVNPLGDATATIDGSGTSNARLVIAVPPARSHDVWVGANNAPRVMQTVADTDFEVETRFESILSAQYQMQGILVQQDESTFLRFDFVRDASTTRFFTASFASGAPTVRKDTTIANGSPLYMRVRRNGNTWTGSFSYDGTTWKTAVSFSQTVRVTAMGPFAGNHGIPESSTPAFTGLVDYFFNTASPIAPEDGGQTPLSPTITAHPQSQTVPVGNSVTFSVAATGTAPLAYQWQRNGTPIQGANVATYTIPTTVAGDSGAGFRCFVSNGIGSATSNAAILSVQTAPPPATIVSDDFSGATINTSLWNIVNPLGDAVFSLTGTGTQDARLSIMLPAGVSHDLWTGAFNAPRILQSIPNTDLSFDVRFESALASQYQFQGIIVQQDAANFIRFDVVRDGSTTRFFAASFSGGIPTIRKDTAIAAGGSIYLRVTRQGSFWTGSFSLNGMSWTTASAFTHALTVTAAGPFAGNHGVPASATPAFTAFIDYVFSTSSPIAPEDGSLIPVAPTIVSHPSSITVTAGQPATFTVTATGTAPLTYQWQRNGTPIGGATSASYSVSSTGLSDSGSTFRCIVTNGVNSATSSSATLNVVAPAPGLTSDNFNSGSLNGSLWTFVNPRGDASVSMSGTQLRISVPAGTSHDLWTGDLNAPRVMQNVPNGDISCETKFDATMLSEYQFQGIVAQQDASTFVRFDLVRDASRTRFFSASFNAGVPTVQKDTTIAGSAPLYLRVRRTGNTWTGSFSYNGTTWTTAVVFSAPLTLTAIGPFAGNAGSAPPAFAALVDYFFNTSSPLIPAGQLATETELNDAAPLPTSYGLMQNYPNPFNPSTTIVYALPVASQVTIRVFNMLGAEVATIVEGERSAGMHQEVFNAAGLPSGVYFCRMNAGTFAANRKLMLVR